MEGKTKIYEKLLEVQTKLKAPKGQRNDFGRYNYRSCEDILEAVKPLLKEEKLLLTMQDDIQEIGGRIYIKAIARIVDVETGETLESQAFAREADQKKGMDESQVTGSTSSYARKYALNALFCIDDTKDPDTNEYAETTRKTTTQQVKKATKKQVENITALIVEYSDLKHGDSEALKKYYLSKLKISKLEDIPEAQATHVIEELTKLIKKEKGE